MIENPPEETFAEASLMRRAIRRAVDEAATGGVHDVLSAPVGDPRGAVYVVRLLEVVPGLGKVAARRLCAEAGVDGFTRVDDLDDSVRRFLVQRCTGAS